MSMFFQNIHVKSRDKSRTEKRVNGMRILNCQTVYPCYSIISYSNLKMG